MDTFKFKITLDRHNAIQNLNYYDLPEPPRFSLPSTFKDIVQPKKRGVERGTIRTVLTSYTIADIFFEHSKG